jgi:hypothetical protein
VIYREKLSRNRGNNIFQDFHTRWKIGYQDFWPGNDQGFPRLDGILEKVGRTISFSSGRLVTILP